MSTMKNLLIRAIERTPACPDGVNGQACPSCVAATLRPLVRHAYAVSVEEQCIEQEHKQVSGEMPDGQYGISFIMCEDCEAIVRNLSSVMS